MRGQIQKRGEGRYLVRVPRGKDASGKRLYHNKTIYGPKRAAQEYLAKVLRELDLGLFVERSKEPLADFLERWLRDVVAQTVRAKTHDDYTALVRRHIVPRLGAFTLAQLTTEAIERAYADMATAGLSARTIAYVHSVLHNALGHAVSRGNLAKNPAAGATRPRPVHREMRALTADEAGRFLEAIRNTRFEALWVLLLTAGIRPAEALGLKWADVEANSITIRRSLVHLGERGAIEEAPKTERAKRTIVLPKSAIQALHTHRIRQNEARLAAGESWHDHDYVFCTQDGLALEWRVIARRYFRPLLRKAELPKIRPYDLRHSCASLLLASGENAKVVSERLGHSKVALTLDVYSHVLPGMQQAAADKLESLLFPKMANHR